MKIPFWHVDAFAGALFGGNPAGVCIVDEWPAVGVLQKIAAENNLPETAFVARRGEVCDLRWFTPAVEVDLCGHATLAAAYVLFSCRGWPGASIEFNTQSGPLVVTRSDDLLVMDFPSRPALPCESPTVLLRGLGREPVEVRGAPGTTWLSTRRRKTCAFSRPTWRSSRASTGWASLSRPRRAIPGKRISCPDSSLLESVFPRTLSRVPRTAPSFRTGRAGLERRDCAHGRSPHAAVSSHARMQGTG
jgi:hypothetical protein